MCFEDIVSVDDVLNFAMSQGWSVGRMPIVFRGVYESYITVAVDPSGYLQDSVLNDSNSVFLHFSRRRISTTDHGFLISTETQRKWRSYVKRIYARRKEQRKEQRKDPRII